MKKRTYFLIIGTVLLAIAEATMIFGHIDAGAKLMVASAVVCWAWIALSIKAYVHRCRYGFE